MAKTSKTPIKKQSQPAKRRVEPKKALFLVLLLLIVAAAIYVLWGYGYRTLYVQPREARINQIYASLNISDDYLLESQNISGEKRVYESDKSRSYSSVKKYVYAGTVGDTFGALDRAIRQAGYTFVNEPYPGSTFKEYHYKSDRGEYIRLSVDSKSRADAAFNFAKMNPGVELPTSIIEADPNAGPANVTIKVNLDDNNE